MYNMRNAFIVLKSFAFTGLLMYVTPALFAQSEFIAGNIKPALLANANAVLRVDETSFEIKSKTEALVTRRYVVTILNEIGEARYNEPVVSYDKFTKISDISGNIYDADGKLLRKLRNADISDFGYGVTGDNDIVDTRFRVADFGKKSLAYPYTIEFRYQTRQRNMMFYPKWMPTADSRTAVEHSVFTIKTPADFKFRYKEYNGVAAVEKSAATDGTMLYAWKMTEVPATKPDAYPLYSGDYKPMVLTAPFDFEIEGYQGNFNSWEDLSRFYHTLNANRDALPPATAAEIKNIVKDAKSDREKVILIYQWVQARSRYVSIQLGIGGWQTIDATTVANKGFGDCKALTNFTLAALRQVGITGYPALILAGEEAQMKYDFPSSQFNHVIACAVLAKDTIWLECTSQTSRPNFMGTFTGGRQALLVMPANGRLVKTPGYGPADNVRNSHTLVNLDEAGNGHIEARTSYSGLQQESRKSLLLNYTKEEQKKWLLKHINLPSMDLQRFELAEEKTAQPRIIEQLTLDVRNCATRTGSRLFVKPSLMSRPLEVPVITERTTDFYLPFSEFAFTDIDTVSYMVPSQYKLETSLPAAQLSSPFGSFEIKTTFVNNRMSTYRKVLLHGGRYPASDYPAWVDFLKKIRKADRTQVVFVENKP
jgi:hypothetical protein